MAINTWKNVGIFMGVITVLFFVFIFTGPSSDPNDYKQFKPLTDSQKALKAKIEGSEDFRTAGYTAGHTADLNNCDSAIQTTVNLRGANGFGYSLGEFVDDFNLQQYGGEGKVEWFCDLDYNTGELVVELFISKSVETLFSTAWIVVGEEVIPTNDEAKLLLELVEKSRVNPDRLGL